MAQLIIAIPLTISITILLYSIFLGIYTSIIRSKRLKAIKAQHEGWIDSGTYDNFYEFSWNELSETLLPVKPSIAFQPKLHELERKINAIEGADNV
jgi:hypothetical protein